MNTSELALLVVRDILYIYNTHDKNVLKIFFNTMENWYVFSTKDIINSTNHVQILSYDDIE